MLDSLFEKSKPTRSVISWLLEGQNKYLQIYNLRPTIVKYSKDCLCPRRRKWNLQAT